MIGKIVKIGNSRGIIIPKPVLDFTKINDEVEIEVREGSIIIMPYSHRRQGWEESIISLGPDNLAAEKEIKQWHELDNKEDSEWTW
ncbi:MAG TPA: AbrB/MazE/SpoVT family DNA-binding domain-containing protein [Cytophagaceae bacterium]|jgi:antitoxin component of MazEF toxin-antitoxin module